jgi:hypothetical protein
MRMGHFHCSFSVEKPLPSMHAYRSMQGPGKLVHLPFSSQML